MRTKDLKCYQKKKIFKHREKQQVELIFKKDYSQKSKSFVHKMTKIVNLLSP